jgi:hypothetical protein
MVANTPSVKFQIVKPSAALERLANAVRQGQLQSKNK